MIDIIYKTVEPSHLKKLQITQNIKNLMFHDVLFSLTLRVPSTDCCKSIASHKKCIFLKNQLFFGSLLSVMRQNSSVLFHLKLYMLQTNEPIKVQIFRLETARMKINQIPYVIFQTTSQFFFKYFITLQCHDI